MNPAVMVPCPPAVAEQVVDSEEPNADRSSGDDGGDPRPRTAMLAGDAEGLAELTALVARGVSGALSVPSQRGPLPTGTPGEVLAQVRAALGPVGLPERGTGSDAALHRMGALLHRFGLDLTHPHAAAHLQPPPLAVAVAADALAGAGNASLDTYDSGPATLAVESWVVETLAALAGLGATAGGVLTPGGSLSNLLALLLARDTAAAERGVDCRRDGVGALRRPVVFASELGHFSVQRACAALGLGEGAVHPIPVDPDRRMRPDALRAALTERGDGVPVAVVATAGTTDFGTIDPLPEIAAIAAEHGVWLHVDAAYGFGALFSERLRDQVTGLALADSITLDLHKMGWQPAAASALLLRDVDRFGALERQVAYLNPPDDADAGLDGLLGRSLQTTRRADAVKIATTLLACGRSGLGALVDTCHDLARHAATRIADEPELELVADATLTTVVFRYRGQAPDHRLDDLNATLRRTLLHTGGPLLGRTEAALPDGGHGVCLKLTLLNPNATPTDLDTLLDTVLTTARAAATVLVVAP